MEFVQSIFRVRRTMPGWMFPMGWFAWFGMLMPVMFGLNGWVQNIVLIWAGWSTLWMVGLIGTFAIGYDSVRNLTRFGLAGVSRPRFHFEIARAAIAAIFMLSAPSLTLSLLFPNMNLGIGLIDFRFLFSAFAAVFVIAAITGYVTSFFTSRKLSGRAYECTSWFFCLGGGMVLVTYGYIAIPDPPPNRWSQIPGILACAVGGVLMICGILAEVHREKTAEEKSNKASEDHSKCSFSAPQSWQDSH